MSRSSPKTSKSFEAIFKAWPLSLVHTSHRLQQPLQTARSQQIIGSFLFLLQMTATVAGCSRFAASLNKPLSIHHYSLVSKRHHFKVGVRFGKRVHKKALMLCKHMDYWLPDPKSNIYPPSPNLSIIYLGNSSFWYT